MFNVAQQAMVNRMAENPKADYLDLCMTAEVAMKEYVKNYIRVIGSNNRYVFGEAKIVGHE